MNIFNKKTILFFSITTLMINGCVAKNEFKTKSSNRVLVTANQVSIKGASIAKPLKKASWNIKKKSIKKEDCVDCYATPIDYSKVALAKVINQPVKRNFQQDKVTDTKYFGAYDYRETLSDTTVKKNRSVNSYAKKIITPAVSYINSSYGSYVLNTAIQVGAFRDYQRAKIYKKRYDALSSRYKVSIKTGKKNNKPLHRVRIEGFKNKNEAKTFMNTYGLTDAFLVRK